MGAKTEALARQFEGEGPDAKDTRRKERRAMTKHMTEMLGKGKRISPISGIAPFRSLSSVQGKQTFHDRSLPTLIRETPVPSQLINVTTI
jgi:hypothetical protein